MGGEVEWVSWRDVLKVEVDKNWIGRMKAKEIKDSDVLGIFVIIPFTLEDEAIWKAIGIWEVSVGHLSKGV